MRSQSSLKGWGDCHLTEWSPWSSCQLTCLEGRSFESVGQQARSRAVVIQALENQDSCPSQVFETRPCKDLQRAVVSSMSRPVSAAPSADGCTTQDYMHTDRYHDCP
ncbi:hypothetical protein NFI96_000527 [Prochilodus magdalenae]|nr:hypothetical protein NFI96_000527 [Prochilodus magdalenae]